MIGQQVVHARFGRGVITGGPDGDDEWNVKFDDGPEGWCPLSALETPVDEPSVGDPEPDYGRIAYESWHGQPSFLWRQQDHPRWNAVAAAVIAAYRAAHPEPAMSRGEAWLDGYEVGEAEGYGRGQTDARAAHPEPQPVTDDERAEFWPSIQQQAEVNRDCTCVQHKAATHLEPADWEQDAYCPEHPATRIILATLNNAIAAVRAARVAAPAPLLPTQEAIAEAIFRCHEPLQGIAALSERAAAAVLDLLGRTQPEPARAALICGACGHEWAAHDDSGCARGMCGCDEPCPDLPPAAGVQEPTPERRGVPGNMPGLAGLRGDADDVVGDLGMRAPEAADLGDGWADSEPTPEPAAKVRPCSTCGAFTSSICSNVYHYNEVALAAAPAPSPDPERPPLVRLTPGSVVTAMAEAMSQPKTTPPKSYARRVYEQMIVAAAAGVPSPDPEADDGTVLVKLPIDEAKEIAREWPNHGQLGLVKKAIRAALAALEETDR